MICLLLVEFIYYFGGELESWCICISHQQQEPIISDMDVNNQEHCDNLFHKYIITDTQLKESAKAERKKEKKRKGIFGYY